MSHTAHTKKWAPHFCPTPTAPLLRYKAHAQSGSNMLVVDDQYPSLTSLNGCSAGSAGECVLQSTRDSSSLMFGSRQTALLRVLIEVCHRGQGLAPRYLPSREIGSSQPAKTGKPVYDGIAHDFKAGRGPCHPEAEFTVLARAAAGDMPPLAS